VWTVFSAGLNRAHFSFCQGKNEIKKKKKRKKIFFGAPGWLSLLSVQFFVLAQVMISGFWE